jgi:hypothetical protein
MSVFAHTAAVRSSDLPATNNLLVLVLAPVHYIYLSPSPRQINQSRTVAFIELLPVLPYVDLLEP